MHHHVFVWGILLLVVLSSLIFGMLSREMGTPRQRFVALAFAITALFWAVWRWAAFNKNNDWGPFRHLSGLSVVFVVVLTALIIIFARLGAGQWLRVFAIALLVFAVAAPFNWSLSGSLGRDYKAECAAQGLLVNDRGDGCAKKQVQVTPEAPAKTAAQCAGFNVAYDDNAGNRVLSNGVTGTPTQVVNSVLAIAKHDTRVLQLYWNATPQGAAKPVAAYQDLETNGCLNSQGQAIYYQTLGAYQSAVKSSEPAPSSGVNTGVTPKGSPFQEAPGKISGNRTAAKVVFKNGVAVYIMHRCGNIVTLTPIPHIPPKPKPTPPTPPTPPTSTPTCKSGVPAGSPSCLPCYSPGNGPTPVGSPQPGQTICPGKDPTHGIANDPAVPPITKGCGADGGIDPNNCTGGTQTSHPTQASPAPATGTTQCGVTGNDPCASPSPRPAPTQPPAPSGAASPPAPGGGGGNYPAPSPGAPSSSPSPISGNPGGGAG